MLSIVISVKNYMMLFAVISGRTLYHRCPGDIRRMCVKRLRFDCSACVFWVMWLTVRPSTRCSKFASRESISRVLTGMTTEQWNQMMEDNGWNEVELRDSRYNQVVHMMSIADASTGRRRHFSSHEGMDIATARQLDISISQVHPLQVQIFILSLSCDCSRTMYITSPTGKLCTKSGKIVNDFFTQSALLSQENCAKIAQISSNSLTC